VEVIPVRERFWEMVREAAQDEADAVSLYRRMADAAPCRAIAHSIEDIARDEMQHFNYFESLLCSRQERGRNPRERRRKDTPYGRTLTIPTISDPYPPIQVEGPNPEYARLLLDDYAGMVSEMTAINQYLFHHFDMPEELADAAQLLEEVAIVEMHHMEILAKLIKLLGQPPMYMDGQGLFWNATFVPYLPGCPCEQLQSDIHAEQIAIETYRRHMELIDDRYIKEILARIIMDEELHLHLFNEAYEKYCGGHTDR
jgi:bacterioferritin